MILWDMDGEVPKEYYSLTADEAVEKTKVKEDGDSYKLRYYEIYG